MKKFLMNAVNIATGLLIPLGLGIRLRRDARTGKRKIRPGFSLKRAVLYAAVYWVLQPMAVFLFPRAEDVLKKEGFDPNTVARVTPVNGVRIVPDNLLGRAYLLFPDSPLMRPLAFAKSLSHLGNKDVNGFTAGFKPGFLAHALSPEVTPVFVKTATKRSREDVLGTTIHEIRHTSPDNRRLTPLFAEVDASYWAAVELAKKRGDENAKTEALDDLAFCNTAGDMDHNTALYLYEKFNNEALPTEDEIRDANREAEPVIGLCWESMQKGMAGDKFGAFDLKQAFNKECEKLSPLARLRVRLFEESCERRFGVTKARERRLAS